MVKLRNLRKKPMSAFVISANPIANPDGLKDFLENSFKANGIQEQINLIYPNSLITGFDRKYFIPTIEKVITISNWKHLLIIGGIETNEIRYIENLVFKLPRHLASNVKYANLDDKIKSFVSKKAISNIFIPNFFLLPPPPPCSPPSFKPNQVKDLVVNRNPFDNGCLTKRAREYEGSSTDNKRIRIGEAFSDNDDFISLLSSKEEEPSLDKKKGNDVDLGFLIPKKYTVISVFNESQIMGTYQFTFYSPRVDANLNIYWITGFVEKGIETLPSPRFFKSFRNNIYIPYGAITTYDRPEEHVGVIKNVFVHFKPIYKYNVTTNRLLINHPF